MKTIILSQHARKWVVFFTVLVFYVLLYLLDKDTKDITYIWNARVIPGLLFYFLPTYLICTVVFRYAGTMEIKRFLAQLIATVIISFLAIIGLLYSLQYVGLIPEA